jgi:hypothetical protein
MDIANIYLTDGILFKDKNSEKIYYFRIHDQEYLEYCIVNDISTFKKGSEVVLPNSQKNLQK